MAEPHLSLADALAVHDRAVQNRVVTEQALDAMLASGMGPITGDGMNMADHLVAAELVERACADQVMRLRQRDLLSFSGVAK